MKIYDVIGDKNKITYHITIQRIRDLDGMCEIEDEQHYNILTEEEIKEIEDILRGDFDFHEQKSIIKIKQHE